MAWLHGSDPCRTRWGVSPLAERAAVPILADMHDRHLAELLTGPCRPRQVTLATLDTTLARPAGKVTANNLRGQGRAGGLGPLGVEGRKARREGGLHRGGGRDDVTMRQALPMLVTMVALACGLAAIEAARTGAWDVSLRLILLAAVADGVDGMLARRFRVVSAMGEQLDSLADIIAFGAAPAFLFSAYYGDASGPARVGVALAFVLAGAYRLARFLAQPTHGAVRGLPITAAGPLLALAVAGPVGMGMREAGAAGIALAALMICHHPFPKVGRSRRWLLPAIAGAALPVVLWPQVETVATVAALTLVIYVAWGFIGQVVVNDGMPAIGVEEVREVGRPRP